MNQKLLAAIVGVAIALIIAGVLYQTGYFAIQNPAETFRTMDNLYLEPKQTQAMNHPIMQGQVAVISIEPYSDDEDKPDY